jgi:hypothetical protein
MATAPRIIGISAASQKVAEENLSFNLTPATDAEEKNGTFKWHEIVKVASAHVEAKTSNAGREMTVFKAKLNVTPLNPASRSAGKNLFFDAYMDVEVWETGDGPEGMVTMNNISITKLKSLLTALGYALDESGDITPEALLALFPIKGEGQSASIGDRVQANVWKGPRKDKRDGSTREVTEIQSFSPYEG